MNIRNITISGDIGTGTTTLGKALAKELGWHFLEGGEIFANIHKDLGISEEEVLKRPDKIDVAFDKKIRGLLSNNVHQVIESHLGGYNAKGIPGIFTIRLICEENGQDREDIRSQRVAKRDSISIEKARAQALLRERGNREKYERVYGVNPYLDESLYAITINTFARSKEEVLRIALDVVRK